MADKIVFKDIHPQYDGEYEFDGSSLTNRELHTIKRLSGCRVGELEDALSAGDTDVVMAIGIIALQRHGKPIDEDVFWDAEAGSITIEFEPEEEEASPPPLTPPATSSASGSENEPSGNGSTSISETPENAPSRTGSRLSDTSATSESTMSATSPQPS